MDETAALVTRARAGDKLAFSTLVEQHRDMLVRLAMRMIGDGETAQELAQEAILQAYLSLRHLRDDALLRSWLYGIGLNICRNYLRLRKAAPLSLEDLMGGMVYDGPLDPQPTVEEIVETRELHRRLQQAVEALTPADREAVLLFYYEGLSVREAAAALAISPGALRVRLHKARGHLRRHLQTGSEKETQTMIPVEVLEVMRLARGEAPDPTKVHYIVLLLDGASERILPIWTGPYEGQAISLALTKTSLARPMTLNFLYSLLEAAGATVESVTVTKLVDDVYYAVTKLRLGDNVHEIDARPSDAIGLAVVAEAPVFVAEEVMEKTGVPMGEQFKAGLAERRESNRLLQEDIAAQFQSTLSEKEKTGCSDPQEMQETLRAMIAQ